MHTTILSYLRSLPPVLLVKTKEEGRFIEDLHQTIKNANSKQKKGSQHLVEIWNPAMGIQTSAAYLDEMSNLQHPVDKQTANIHNMLIEFYRRATSPDGKKLYTVMLDVDNYMRDSMVRRRILNVANSASQHPGAMRCLILVSQSGYVHPMLEPYVQVVDFDNPTRDLLKAFLTALEEKLSVGSSTPVTFPAGRDADAEIPAEFVDACRGMTLFEVKQAVMYLAINQKREVSVEDMQAIRQKKIEQTSLLDLLKVDTTFEDVAGLDRLKERLDEVRQAWTPEGRHWGVPNCRGLLMVGVPGCGKSLIAQALSNEMDVNYVKFDPSKLFSSRVGDSEANMRDALAYIEAVSPCVVFIDEVEKGLAGIQSSSYSDSGTTARVIGSFLSWFQDHGEDIFIVATANGINSLPPELVSRFEEKFFVGLPDLEARKECFRIQLSKYWKDPMGDIESIDLDALANASINLTGREIEQAVCDAMRKAFLSEGKVVTTEILEDVVRTKPPLVTTMREQVQELLEWVGYDSTRNEGVRAKYASSAGIVEIEAFQAQAINNDRMAELFAEADEGAMN
jgi:ATP-dependent 26S proteasome regulatory subunit